MADSSQSDMNLGESDIVYDGRHHHRKLKKAMPALDRKYVDQEMDPGLTGLPRAIEKEFTGKGRGHTSSRVSSQSRRERKASGDSIQYKNFGENLPGSSNWLADHPSEDGRTSHSFDMDSPQLMPTQQDIEEEHFDAFAAENEWLQTFREGEVDKVRSALENHRNEPSKSTMQAILTWLWFAIEIDDVLAVRVLIHQRPPPPLNDDGCDDGQGSVLHHAAEFGSSRVVPYLLRAGADPDFIEPKHKQTALHSAADASEHTRTRSILSWHTWLDYYAKPHVSSFQDEEGPKRSPEGVQRLEDEELKQTPGFREGDDLNESNDYGKRFWPSRFLERTTEIARQLVEHKIAEGELVDRDSTERQAYIDLLDDYGNTALYGAVRSRNAALVAYLIEQSSGTALQAQSIRFDLWGDAQSEYRSHEALGTLLQFYRKFPQLIVERNGNNGSTLLHWFAQDDKGDETEWMLRQSQTLKQTAWLAEASNRTPWDLCGSMAVEQPHNHAWAAFAAFETRNQLRSHEEWDAYDPDEPEFVLTRKEIGRVGDWFVPLPSSTEAVTHDGRGIRSILATGDLDKERKGVYRLPSNSRFNLYGHWRNKMIQDSRTPLFADYVLPEWYAYKSIRDIGRRASTIYSTLMEDEYQNHDEYQLGRFWGFRMPYHDTRTIKLPEEGDSDYEGVFKNVDYAYQGLKSVRCVKLAMPYFYVEPLSGVLNRAGWCEKYAQSFTACKSGAAFRKRSLADMAHMPLLPPTLDEYHYPALTQAALDQRNKDQVLKKYGKGVSGEELIICVHQLWIWDISGVHIDLIYPYHVDDDFPALINDFLSIINEDYSDPEGIRAVAIGVLMSRMIDMLEARPKTLMSRSILAVFESALADLSEQVRLYAKKIDFAEVDIDEEKRFFHEIADIQNELAMIKSVLLQQEEVWRDYAYNMWPDQWEGGREGRFLLPQDYGVLDQDTWREVLRPQTQFQKYKRRIAHIEDEAQRVEKTITAFLDLKQKHATMQETHATGVMSAAVVGFTVITIIFTPLSFLVALFALPIDTFQDRQTVSRFTDESGTYSRGYIAKWAVATEIASLAVTVVLTFIGIEFLFYRGKNIKGWWKRLSTKSVKSSSIAPKTKTAESSDGSVEMEKTSSTTRDDSSQAESLRKRDQEKWFRRRQKPKSTPGETV